MKLYFVRHGLSEGNISGKHQGTDEELSSEGKEQARFIAKRFENVKVDKIFSSPLVRARQTAEIISKSLKKEIEFRDELKEVPWPPELVGLHHGEVKSKQIRDDIRKNIHDPDYKYSNEESFNEVKSRASIFLDHALKDHKDEDVICVAHGLIIKIFVGLILFEEEFNSVLFFKLRDNSWIDNIGITEIGYTDKWAWTLLSWNDTTHL